MTQSLRTNILPLSKRRIKAGKKACFLCQGCALLCYVIVALSLLSCNATPKESSPLSDSDFIPKTFEYQCLTTGIDILYFKNSEIPLRYTLVRIDLQVGIELLCYPSASVTLSTDGGIPKIRVSDFSRNKKAYIAINTTPFANLSWGKARLAGVHTVPQREICAPVARYAALLLKRGANGCFTARILPNQNEAAKEGGGYLFGGFFSILIDGEEVNFAHTSEDSRTAVGTSPDGGTLYILCVEGENKSSSRGLSYQDCARIFKALGCKDAMQFDGGGSTSLYSEGTSLLSYGTLRAVAACIGFSVGNL